MLGGPQRSTVISTARLVASRRAATRRAGPGDWLWPSIVSRVLAWSP